MAAGNDGLSLPAAQHTAPALRSIAAAKPDAFAWLGDAIYNDMDAEGDLCEPSQCGRASPLTRTTGALHQHVHAALKRVAPQLAEAASACFTRPRRTTASRRSPTVCATPSWSKRCATTLGGSAGF